MCWIRLITIGEIREEVRQLAKIILKNLIFIGEYQLVIRQLAKFVRKFANWRNQQLEY